MTDLRSPKVQQPRAVFPFFRNPFILLEPLPRPDRQRSGVAASLFPAPRARGTCVNKEAMEFAAGRVERSLLFLRAVMNQWAAVRIDRSMQNPIYWPLSQRRILVEIADDLPAQHPQVVHVFLNGFG